MTKFAVGVLCGAVCVWLIIGWDRSINARNSPQAAKYAGFLADVRHPHLVNGS